jgi:NAD(P)-dependent dehydrogenase (short-subunit alcohol dehydrogenase family)
MGEFLSYAGRRVVISGCFSGMGQATARLLLELGAEVHGLDYRDCALPLASFARVDLRDPTAIAAYADGLGRPVDGLFNCAGLPSSLPPLDIMKVNFLGARALTEALLPSMPPGAAIASIASTGGIQWAAHMEACMGLLATDGFEAGVQWCAARPETVGEGYAFSKEALIVWTLFNAAPLIRRGVRINCILPGPTKTPLLETVEATSPASVLEAAAQPINRRAEPAEQAAALVFLNSARASYVNGAALPVDGGFMGALATGQVDLAAMMGRPDPS